jgi:hypothetical protein
VVKVLVTRTQKSSKQSLIFRNTKFLSVSYQIFEYYSFLQRRSLMYKRLILVISIILLLFGAATVNAVPSRWVSKSPGTTHDWHDPNCWKDEAGSMIDPPGAGDIISIEHTYGGPYTDWAEINGDDDVNTGTINFGYTDSTPITLTATDDGLFKVTAGRIISTHKFGYRLGQCPAGEDTWRNKMQVTGGEVHALNAAGFGIRVGQVRAYDHRYEQSGGTVVAPKLCINTKPDSKTTGNQAYLSGGTLELTGSTTIDPPHCNKSVFFANHDGHLEMSDDDGGGTLIFSHADATIGFVEQCITDGLLQSEWHGREKWTIVDTGDIEVTVASYLEGAYNFDPPTGSKLDRYDTTFTWSEGEDVNGPMNVIYWSTNKADVDAGAPAAWDSNSLSNTFITSPLALSTTYYLRVDEEDTVSGEVYPGPTLQYTCNDSVEVDYIEGYVTDSNLEAFWNDRDSGHAMVGNTAQVNVITDPVREIWLNYVQVQISTESMRMSYDDGGGYTSEIVHDYGAGDLQDFSAASGGIKALVIYFHGFDENAISGLADDLYCALEDGDGNKAAAYYPDKTDLDQGIWSMLWHEFNIDLAALALTGSPANLDLTEVRKVYLGVGNFAAGTGTPGNNGNVLFEDIGLHPSRCVFSEGPDADFYHNRDGITYYDCAVNNEDLRTMGGAWLASAPGTVTAAVGTTGEPIAMWKFDETDGTAVAVDSANIDANTYDLTATDAGTTHWENDAEIGDVHPDLSPGIHSVLELEGNFRMSIGGAGSPHMPALWGYFDNAISISLWARGDQSAYNNTISYWPDGGTLFKADRVADADARMITVNFPQKHQLEVGCALWRCGDSDINGSDPDDYDDCRWNNNTKGNLFYGQWNHLAVTKDRTTGLMTLYINGVIRLQECNRTKAFNPMLADPVAYFGVGAGNDVIPTPSMGYWGRMYDVRLYDYALTHAEVLFLADVASNVPGLMLEGDADGDDDVDMGDYAKLADTFLTTQLWPLP